MHEPCIQCGVQYGIFFFPFFFFGSHVGQFKMDEIAKQDLMVTFNKRRRWARRGGG